MMPDKQPFVKLILEKAWQYLARVQNGIKHRQLKIWQLGDEVMRRTENRRVLIGCLIAIFCGTKGSSMWTSFATGYC